MADALAGANPPVVDIQPIPVAVVAAPPVVAPAVPAAPANIAVGAGNGEGLAPPTQPATAPAIANTPVAEPSKPVSPLVTLLGVVQNEIGTVPKIVNTGNPVTSLREWWSGDAIRMSGTVSHDYFHSSDRDVWHGLMEHLFDYRAEGDVVDVRTRWPADGPPFGWTAIEEPTIGREKYGYPANLTNAIERAGTGDWTPLTQILRTRSWSLDGTSLVNFTRLLGQTMAMSVGFSPAAVFCRIFGYILSGCMPIDRGGPGTAIFPDPGARGSHGRWFPFSGIPGDAAPEVSCIYVTSEVFVRWQLGHIILGDYLASDIDRSILIVPVDHEFLLRPAALAVLAIGMMEYPVRGCSATGAMFDLVNPLNVVDAAGAQVAYTEHWLPASSLVRIRGPGNGGANSVRIVFVRSTGSPMAGGVETLTLPGGINIAIITAGVAAIPPGQIGNFGLTLDILFGDNVNMTANLPHFWEGFLRACALFGAGQAITTMVQFWGASCTLTGRPWESCGVQFGAGENHTFINGVAPRFSHERGVVKEVAQIIDTPNLAHPSWVVLNSIGQMWNVEYPAGGGGGGARSASAIHWYLPQFSSIFGVAVACGIVVPDPLSQPLAFGEATDLVGCILRVGVAYTALSDVFFLSRNMTREIFHTFLAGVPDVVADAAFLRGLFGSYWGSPTSRPLLKVESVTDIFRRQVFLDKLAAFYPLNGRVFSGGVAGWRDCGLGTSNLCGKNIFARFSVPTLSRFLELPYSTIETSDFREQFFSAPIMVRNAANTVNDYGSALALAQSEWDRTWKQSREFAGCFGEAGAATLGAFRFFARGTPTLRHYVTTAQQSDGAVISLAAGEGGIEDLTGRFGLAWDKYHSPTLDRPFTPLDFKTNLSIGLVCTNRQLARASKVYFFPRLAYDLAPHLSDWIDNTTDAVGLLSLIGVSPF